MINLLATYKTYVIAFVIGFMTAMWACSFRIETLKAEHLAERLAIAESTTETLVNNQNLIDLLDDELTQTRMRLQQTAKDLEKTRDEALKTDGDIFTGLGRDSLQHYRRALGYSD